MATANAPRTRPRPTKRPGRSRPRTCSDGGAASRRRQPGVAVVAPGRVLVAVGFGCSLGDRRGTLEIAVRRLGTRGLRLLRVSRWYRSPPLAGGTARNAFLNGVALYETALTPDQVLSRCRDLESAFGRRRARHWGDRTLDVDVLQYGDLVRSDAVLTLPHPAIARRPFVHGPLLEVWPDAIDPRTGTPWASIACNAVPRPWPIGIPRRNLGGPPS